MAAPGAGSISLWGRLSFFQKLTGAFLLAVALPVVCLSVINYQLACDNMRARNVSMLKALSRNVADDIDKYIVANQKLIKYLGLNGELMRYAREAVQPGGNKNKLEKWLASQAAISHEITSLFLLDTQGKCVASSDARFIGQDYSVRYYFREAMEGREYRSDWSVGLTTGTPGFFLSVPVKDADDVVGVLVMKLGVSQIVNLIEMWKGFNMDAFLINGQGIILHHTREQYNYHSIISLTEGQLRRIADDRQFSDVKIESLALPALHAAFSAARPGGLAEQASYLLLDSPKVAALTRMREQDWVVCVAMQESAIKAGSGGILLTTLIISAVAVLASIGVGLLVARLVARPLLAIAATVNQFAAGGTSVRAEVRSNDEVGTLASSFNRMADTINEYTTGLEAKVHERTAELEGVSHKLMDELNLQEVTAEKLRKSEERFRLLAENFNAVVWSLDAATQRLIYVGPYIEKLRGYTPEETMSQTLDQMLTPQSYEYMMREMKAAVERFMETKDRAVFPVLELEQPCKDGRVITVEMVVSVITDKGGEIREFIGIAKDISERKAAEAKLNYLSNHDHLTGLYNRAYFTTELDRAAEGRRFPVSIIAADLDGLKVVNDNKGHEAGDKLIKAAALVLQRAFRGDDIVARLGGDEFAAILYEMDEDGATKALARIRSCEAAYNQEHPDLQVGISLGGVTALEADDIPQAMRLADFAMYADKRQRKERAARP